jgi:hypothetical protein
VSALLTFAYNRWVREPGGRPAEGAVLAETFGRQLCLNGQQEKCIMEFRFAFDSEISVVQERMREKRLALVEELKGESPDGTTLDKLIDEISRLQAEIQKKAVENILKEKEVLTDEQKEKFFRLIEDHICTRTDGADRDGASVGPADCRQELGR